MKLGLRIAAFLLALAFLALTFVDASWLAPSPRGYVRLVASKGLHQIGVGRCTAKAIEPPLHEFLENTVAGAVAAGRSGAQMVSLDLQMTSDGHLVLLGEPDLACRTSGQGMVGEHTLAELTALDAGHGYTPDGGRSFPFRGHAVGAIPALEEVLTALPEKPLLFDLPADPRAGAQLVATLQAAGRDPLKVGDAFRGLKADLAPIAKAWPKAWLWDRTRAAECTAAYRWQGWFGITPQACAGQTIVVPGDSAWLFAGWPNRLQARMAEVGARTVMTGPAGAGLILPEQIRAIPASYTGYVMVEDIWSVGPAVREGFNKRNPRQEEELAATLERRRKALN